QNKKSFIKMKSVNDISLFIHKTSQMKLRPNTSTSLRPIVLLEKISHDKNSQDMTIEGYVRGSGLTPCTPFFLNKIRDIPISSYQSSSNSNGENELMIHDYNNENIDEQIEIINAMNISQTITDIKNSVLQDSNIVNESDKAESSFDEEELSQTVDTQLTEYTKDMLQKNDYDNSDEEELFEEIPTSSLNNKLKPSDDIFRVPLDENLRERLKYYRGIRNLKSYNWPKEEYLPVEYSQIYRFTNYNHQIKAINDLKDNKNTVISKMFEFFYEKLNKYCQIVAKNVTIEQYQELSVSNSKIGYGLLKYEGLPTIIHCSFYKADPEAEFTSDKEYIVVMGYRCFKTSILFSEDNNIDKKCVILYIFCVTQNMNSQ
ncbi:MAG: ribosome biogenesis protein tsr1, partial [Paramarteilia canceri]